MKSCAMAILCSTDGLLGDDNNLRAQLWAQAAQLLQPTLGKVCRRFEPAGRAWGQSIPTPYSIILGRSDPALFTYFYSVGKQKQDEAVQFHLGGFLENLDLSERTEDACTISYSANPKPNGEKALSAHLFWHLGMMGGEIFPDAGIYYAPACQSCITEKLHQQILGNIKSYAIAMVRFSVEASDV